MTIQEARNIAEGEAGRKLTDREFRFVLCYTKRKARLTGHDVSYVPLLLMKSRIMFSERASTAFPMSSVVASLRLEE